MPLQETLPSWKFSTYATGYERGLLWKGTMPGQRTTDLEKIVHKKEFLNQWIFLACLCGSQCQWVSMKLRRKLILYK